MHASIKLTNDQIDQVVIADLKFMYKILKKPDRDEGGYLLEPDNEMLAAIDKVVRYYMTPEQQKEWLNEMVGN